MRIIPPMPVCEQQQREAEHTDFDAGFEASLPIDTRNVATLLKAANNAVWFSSKGTISRGEAIGRLFRIVADLARIAARKDIA